MKAAYYEEIGLASSVLKIGEIDKPEPQAGEVRIKLIWSGVNPSDCKSRAGLRSKVMPFPRVIPHSDGMGIVDALGAGVDSLSIGQRVWIWNGAWGRAHGTAAEFICLPAEQAVALADNVINEAAACFGIPALTAMHAVIMDGGVAGKTVLVSGGAGAVGHYAVQMASLLGATKVIATVSTPEKSALAKAAGADEVVFYKNENLVNRVSELTNGLGVDRIIEMDIGANGTADVEMLKLGGECVAYGSGSTPFELPFFPLIAKNLQLKFFIVYNLSKADREKAISTLNDLLKQDKLIHNIAAKFELNEIAKAHELVESGKAIGNVVVQI